jgi:hypothetical protein
MTLHRLRKADIRSGGGSLTERNLRRRFKHATQVKKVRMCRGCSRPKDQCNCPKSCLEASRRFNAVIAEMKAEWRKQARTDRIKRRRARFKVVR